MALLNILIYPDPRLHKIADKVSVFDDALKKLVSDMAETMYEAPGVGLAATQINIHRQVIVIDISETKDDLKVLINPEIVWASEQSLVFEEGCLSVPGIYDEVKRPGHVRVRAQDVSGNFFEFDAQNLLAVCVQHEMDHLKGKVFVEYLSLLKRDRIKLKLKKESRLRQKEAKSGRAHGT